MPVKNLYIFIFVSFLLCSTFSFAMPFAQQTNQHSQPTPQQQGPSPVDILEKSIRNVLYFLTQPESDNTVLLKKYISSEITPNFDFDYMARWAAGKRYYLMNAQQKSRFTQKFKRVFITNFIKKITHNKKSLPRASRFSSTRHSQTEARAGVILSYYGGLRVKVDFRFFKTPNGWKVVDVKANGLSALLYYRNYFNRLIRQQQN